MQDCWAGLCRQQFWHGPGAQGTINLQGFPYFAFTCLKLFQNLATEIQVIKHTLLECKGAFAPLSLLGEKTMGNEFVCSEGLFMNWPLWYLP